MVVKRVRTLKVERLDQRFCFASDLAILKAIPELAEVEILRHNHVEPTDVNVDGITSPFDALAIINELNLGSPNVDAAMMVDTNGDNVVSPIDALIVINKLNLAASGQRSDSSANNGDKKPVTDPPAGDDDLLANGDGTESGLKPEDFAVLSGRTFDPTNDNGNGYFETGDNAAPLLDSIEAKLRKQLKLADSASIQVATYIGGGETRSGTWRYLTVDGLSMWGNWRQTPDELRLFLSNVEEENRIYGQYPDGSFVYFSWLEEKPVGFYFTPLRDPAVTNPVPIEKYFAYFDTIEGAGPAGQGVSDFFGFDGDVGTFSGVFPIENLLRDLYAIQAKWLQG